MNMCYEDGLGSYVVLTWHTSSPIDSSLNDDYGNIWEMHFERARSRTSAREGIIFTSTTGELVHIVDECNYVRHSPAYKPVKCGSLQVCESFSQLTNLGESP
jgi:hypothetical protein